MTVLTALPPSPARASFFSTLSRTLFGGGLCLFGSSHANGHKVRLDCGFHLHWPVISNAECFKKVYLFVEVFQVFVFIDLNGIVTETGEKTQRKPKSSTCWTPQMA